MEGEQQPDIIEEKEATVDEDNKDYVLEDVEISQVSKGDLSYKEVSEMSEATEESFPEGIMGGQGAKDLANYERLLEQTKQKLQILDSESRAGDELSISSTKIERSDEFLRNFFIKFGMKKTLDSFQQEWFELKAKGQLDMGQLPKIP